MANEIKLDDSSPRLTWSENRPSRVLIPDDIPEIYNGTYTVLTMGHSMTFTFTGSYVAVYGVVYDPEPPGTTSTYVLDGGDPKTFSHTASNVTAYQVLFYSATTSSSALHTLVVTNTSPDPTFIDYVLYIPSAEATTTTTTSPSPSSARYTSNSLTNELISTAAANSFTLVTFSSSSLFSSVMGSGAVTTSTTSFNTLSSSLFPISSTESSIATTIPTTNVTGGHRINVGAVAGGAAGTVLVVAALLLWLRIYHRRTRKRWEIAREKMDTSIEPYADDVHSQIALHPKPALDATPTSLPPSAPVPLSAPVTRTAVTSSPALLLSHVTPASLPLSMSTSSSVSASSLVTNPVEVPIPRDTRQVEIQPPAPIRTTPRQHEDGGFYIQWEPLQDVDSSEDIPPVYRQYSSGRS